MPSYRCYFLDAADHFAATELIHCETDTQAQARADILLAAFGCLGTEVWDCGSEGALRVKDRRVFRSRVMCGRRNALSVRVTNTNSACDLAFVVHRRPLGAWRGHIWKASRLDVDQSNAARVARSLDPQKATTACEGPPARILTSSVYQSMAPAR